MNIIIIKKEMLGDKLASVILFLIFIYGSTKNGMGKGELDNCKFLFHSHAHRFGATITETPYG